MARIGWSASADEWIIFWPVDLRLAWCAACDDGPPAPSGPPVDLPPGAVRFIDGDTEPARTRYSTEENPPR